MLTLEQEVINRTNFVDTEITRIPNILENWYIRVYMWNNHTDKTVQACVYHPPEYKHSSVRYFLKRLPPDVISKIEKEEETKMNQGISHNNSHPRKTLNGLDFEPPSNKKWRVNFTYIWKWNTYVTNIYTHEIKSGLPSENF